MTYDIDGDGVVSIDDYKVARRFDKDLDGILNPQEREQCITALKNGLEDTLRHRETFKDLINTKKSRQAAAQTKTLSQLREQRKSELAKTSF